MQGLDLIMFAKPGPRFRRTISNVRLHNLSVHALDQGAAA